MTSPRDELWALACTLNRRHQSQLKLLARQARRGTGARGRRWWQFETDYAHPLQIPAARRLVLTTWRLRPLARAVHDTAGLAAAVALCARFSLSAATNAGGLGLGLALFSAMIMVLILAVMRRRIGAAIRLMRG
jgi:hypothetical protein